MIPAKVLMGDASESLLKETRDRRTLGSTARARLLLRVWCQDCRHRADLDPGEQAERYGADLAVPEWAARLGCSGCGSVAPDQAGSIRNIRRRIGATGAGGYTT
jgi:hypothetical protein